MKKILLGAFLIGVLTIASATRLFAVEVVEIIGGDRYRLDTGEEVRLAGVDTRWITDPGSRGESFSTEALNYISGLFKTADLRIEDAEDQGPQEGDRTVYIYLIEDQKNVNEEDSQALSVKTETLVNLEIIRRGYGKMKRGYRGRYRRAFEAAEHEAKSNKAGFRRL